MTSKISFTLMLTGLILAMGCGSNPSADDNQLSREESTVPQDSTDTVPKFIVSVDDAIKDINRYDSVMRKYDSIVAHTGYPVLTNLPFKAFTVRAVDLMEALGIPIDHTSDIKYQYVRAYIGLNKENEFRMFLTPVIGANLDANPPVPGKDHVLKRKVKNGNGELEKEEGYVMDFAMPCPNTCPDKQLILN